MLTKGVSGVGKVVRAVTTTAEYAGDAERRLDVDDAERSNDGEHTEK